MGKKVDLNAQKKTNTKVKQHRKNLPNITANNKKFLRYFWEINSNNSKKWVPYAKGGNYRKYFGNIDLY